MRLTITAALFASLLICGCSTAAATENDDGACKLSERIERYATAKAGAIDAENEREAARAANVAIAEQRAEEAAIAAEIENQALYADYGTSYEYYEPVYYAPSYSVPSEGLTPQSGVNYHDGRTETFYSSSVLYHYRTNEWTADSEGFYRDSDGRYVVAASDMPQGTVFEGSKGECIVLDSGCAEGVTDYYVNWN